MPPEFDVTSYLVENLRLHTFWLDGGYVDVKKIWGMEGLCFTTPMVELYHALNEEVWDDGIPFEIGHQEPHWSLTLAADLDYRIIITTMPDQQHDTVVDGRHRLMKAWLLGHTHVRVKFIEYHKLIQEAHVPDEVVNPE